VIIVAGNPALAVGGDPRRMAHLLGSGLLVVASITILLAGGASAKVETEPPAARSERSAEGAAETGGHPLIAPGPFRLACLQDGVRIAEGRGLDQIAIPPSSLIGALSFRRSGARSRSIIVPLGDGLTTCVLSPEVDHLRPAAAAVERAIVTNRVATWSSALAEASGRVEPVRSFADARGRICREFTQSMTIAGHHEIGRGVACRSRRGSWRLVR
jgi:surface antigen